MTPAVEEAIAELRAAFPDNGVAADPEPQGGAYVIVHDLFLGPQYRPERSWVGFLIPYNYPYADVYPLFTDPTLARVDGQPLGVAFQRPIAWHGRSTTQISRRSNHWNPSEDTAATKLAKVLDWMGAQ